jgi:thioredoxin 1
MRRLAIAFTLVALTAGPVLAATEAPYTAVAFAAAQKADKPILVHVTAPWCPTCAQQRPILSKLEAEPQFRDLQVFDVDFDSQKDVLHAMGVQMQSTLIAFHGAQERARSTGATSEEAISTLLGKTQGVRG